MSTRSVVGARIFGWSLVVLGAGHLLTVALDLVRTPDLATAQAMAALRQASVAMPGPQHNLEQLLWGYSTVMGLMVIAFGAAFLWAARRAPEGLGSLLWMGTLVALIGLVISVLLMPLPPTIGLSVALVGAAIGLTERRGRAKPVGVAS
jgi:hypothetical protein